METHATQTAHEVELPSQVGAGRDLTTRSFKIALAVVALLGFVYLGRHYFSELSRISEARLAGLLAIALIHVFTLWLQGCTLRCGLQPFGNHITGKQGFALSVMGSYANLLLPRSGIAATAAFLKQQCQTKLIDFSSIVLYNGGLFVLSSSLLACGVVAWDWSVSGVRPEFWLLCGLPALALISAAGVLIKWQVPAGYQGWGSAGLHKLCHASQQLSHSKNFWSLVGLNLLMTVSRAARLYAAFWALAVDVHPLGVLLASALGDLAFVFAVTPAALGFREAAITFSAGAMATTSSLALSVALFDRLVFSATVVILAQFIVTWVVSQRRRHGRPAANPASNFLISGSTRATRPRRT